RSVSLPERSVGGNGNQSGSENGYHAIARQAPLIQRRETARGKTSNRRSLLVRTQRRGAECGTPGRDRTCDPSLRRRMLYPLSYWGQMLRAWSLRTQAIPVESLASPARK